MCDRIPAPQVPFKNTTNYQSSVPHFQETFYEKVKPARLPATTMCVSGDVFAKQWRKRGRRTGALKTSSEAVRAVGPQRSAVVRSLRIGMQAGGSNRERGSSASSARLTPTEIPLGWCPMGAIQAQVTQPLLPACEAHDGRLQPCPQGRISEFARRGEFDHHRIQSRTYP